MQEATYVHRLKKEFQVPQAPRAPLLPLLQILIPRALLQILIPRALLRLQVLILAQALQLAQARAQQLAQVQIPL